MASHGSQGHGQRQQGVGENDQSSLVSDTGLVEIGGIVCRAPRHFNQPAPSQDQPLSGIDNSDAWTAVSAQAQNGDWFQGRPDQLDPINGMNQIQPIPQNPIPQPANYPGAAQDQGQTGFVNNTRVGRRQVAGNRRRGNVNKPNNMVQSQNDLGYLHENGNYVNNLAPPQSQNGYASEPPKVGNYADMFGPLQTQNDYNYTPPRVSMGVGNTIETPSNLGVYQMGFNQSTGLMEMPMGDPVSALGFDNSQQAAAGMNPSAGTNISVASTVNGDMRDAPSESLELWRRSITDDSETTLEQPAQPFNDPALAAQAGESVPAAKPAGQNDVQSKALNAESNSLLDKAKASSSLANTVLNSQPPRQVSSLTNEERAAVYTRGLRDTYNQGYLQALKDTGAGMLESLTTAKPYLGCLNIAAIDAQAFQVATANNNLEHRLIDTCLRDPKEHKNMHAMVDYVSKRDDKLLPGLYGINQEQVSSVVPPPVASPAGSVPRKSKPRRAAKKTKKAEFTLPGARRKVSYNIGGGVVDAMSYDCSNGVKRILESTDLLEAEERTRVANAKTQAAAGDGGADVAPVDVTAKPAAGHVSLATKNQVADSSSENTQVGQPAESRATSLPVPAKLQPGQLYLPTPVPAAERVTTAPPAPKRKAHGPAAVKGSSKKPRVDNGTESLILKAQSRPASHHAIIDLTEAGSAEPLSGDDLAEVRSVTKAPEDVEMNEQQEAVVPQEPLPEDLQPVADRVSLLCKQKAYKDLPNSMIRAHIQPSVDSIYTQVRDAAKQGVFDDMSGLLKDAGYLKLASTEYDDDEAARLGHKPGDRPQSSEERKLENRARKKQRQKGAIAAARRRSAESMADEDAEAEEVASSTLSTTAMTR